MTSTLAFLWAIYFGLAPIVWLPGIAPRLLYFVKLLLICFLVFSTWLRAAMQGNFSLPPGLLGIGGLLALMFSASFGFIQSDIDSTMRRSIDLIMPFGMLWSMFLIGRDPRLALLILIRASLIVSVFSVLVVSQSVISIPGWISPAEYNYQPLTTAGFEARRTGWSNGVALYASFALLLPIIEGRHRRVRSLIAALCIVSILASQYIVGGRGGLLASVIMVLLTSAFVLPRRWFALIAITVVLLFAFASGSFIKDATEHLRADRLQTGADTYSKLDHFSAGRIGAYVAAIDMIQARPLLGYGFGSEDALFGGMDVHNLWLRLALEGGYCCP